MSALPEDPGHFVRLAGPPGARDRGRAGRPSRRAGSSRATWTRPSPTPSTGRRDRLAAPRPRPCRRRAPHPGGRRSSPPTTGTTCAPTPWSSPPGLPAAGHDWAPAGARRSSPFFVADPWAPGALDVVRRDRVGAGRRAARRDRPHHGRRRPLADPCRRPRGPHGCTPSPAAASCPRGPRRGARGSPRSPTSPTGVTPWPSSGRSVARARRSGCAPPTGDWRPAMDGLRVPGQRRCGSDSPRRTAREFLPSDAGDWNRRAAPDAPSSARCCRELARPPAGCATSQAARSPTRSRCRGGGLRVDARRRHDRTTWAGWSTAPVPPLDVTPPRQPAARRPAHRARRAWPWPAVATAGMGFRTERRAAARLDRDDRRADLDARARCAGASCGSPRRSRRSAPRRWASAAAVLDAVAPLPRRLADGRLVSGHHPVARPRDPLGLPLSTTAEAAARVQRRPRAGDAAAVRRRGADPRGGACSTRASRWATPRWRCSATRPAAPPTWRPR